MRPLCTKTFEFDEGSLPDMRYHVSIYFRGRQVESFVRDTQRQAVDAAIAAGYDGIRPSYDNDRRASGNWYDTFR